MTHNDEFYLKLLDNIQDGIYFVDVYGKITLWNKAAEQITGYSAEEVIGSSCMDNILVHVDACGRELCNDACPLKDTLNSGANNSAEVFLHHKKGQRVPVFVTASPITDDMGEIIGAIEIFRDTSVLMFDRVLLEELKRMALLDSLTEIANRRYLEMKLKAALSEFMRHDIKVGVIFADIDHFKEINDHHGHGTGDDMLRMVARTLTGNIRINDMAGRWGGEEFVIIFTHIETEGLKILAEKLRMLVENSFILANGARVQVTISMGASMARQDDTEASLLKRTDELLYSAKRAGRNRVVMELEHA